jgi:hypothetical protein
VPRLRAFRKRGLVLFVGSAHPVLRGGIGRRRSSAKPRRSPVHLVLTRGERYIAATTSALPDGEANQLHPASGPELNCSSASASFPGGLPLSFRIILVVIAAASRSGEMRPTG